MIKRIHILEVEHCERLTREFILCNPRITAPRIWAGSGYGNNTKDPEKATCIKCLTTYRKKSERKTLVTRHRLARAWNRMALVCLAHVAAESAMFNAVCKELGL